DAIEEAHARPFLSLDNQKRPVCAGSAEHAPRHSESFPGQPCAFAGTTTERWANQTASIERDVRAADDGGEALGLVLDEGSKLGRRIRHDLGPLLENLGAHGGLLPPRHG